jgi:hypothetical protein
MISEAADRQSSAQSLLYSAELTRAPSLELTSVYSVSPINDLKRFLNFPPSSPEILRTPQLLLFTAKCRTPLSLTILLK